MDYDHIVVGAGSAGAILASRLSEDPNRSVLLLEAGPDYPNLEEMPEEIKYGLGRRIFGRPLGPPANTTGTSLRDRRHGSHDGGSKGKDRRGIRRHQCHVMAARNPEDYNAGLRRATTSGALPSFFRISIRSKTQSLRTTIGAAWPYQGQEFQAGSMDRRAAFYEACRAAGYPDCPDHNRPDSSGVGPLASNCFEGVRWSAAIGYINQARHRPNLTIRPDCLVHRVLFGGQRARGVLVESGGELFPALGHETVLCAGAIGSPHILLLSGIGPSEQLRAFGVDLVKDLPGVGKNLRDHPQVSVLWRTRPEFDPLAPKAQVILRYCDGSELRNDRHYGWSHRWTPPRREACVKTTVCLNLALGSGTLSLQSNDPNIQPSLNYRYLETETDRQRLGEAVRISAALGDQAAFHSLIEARVSPSDEDLGSDQALEEWMLNEVVTSHHSSGTCKMGPLTDPTAVVDQYGRVYGTNGLRVADASIMPDCIRGNTNATVMAIGERIADFVKEGR